MLKIRSTLTDGKQTGQVKEWMMESRKSESPTPAFSSMRTDSVHKNAHQNTSSSSVHMSVPRLDLPDAPFEFSKSREETETAESLCTDEPALETPEADG